MLRRRPRAGPDPENPDPESPDPESPDPESPAPESPAPDPARRAGLLGSGTGLRFVLLLVLVTASTVAMTPDHIVLRLVLGDPDNDVLGCLLAAGVDPAGGWPTNSAALTGRNAAALRACVAPYEPAWWSGGAVVLAVLALAAALCWVMPLWRIRRRGLRPLAASSPEHAVLAAFAARAGVPSARFTVDWASTSTNAVAFGRPGRAYVALPAGLLQTRSSHPARFAASVLHELAHLRYRDVGLTYATVALWRVFAVVMLLPYLARMVQLLVQGQLLRTGAYSEIFVASGAPDELVKLTLCLFTAVLVYLSRSDILRTREFHADRQAVDWGADLAVWDDAARSAAARGTWAAVRSALLAEHPSWTHRAQALRDPEVLVRTPAVPTFLTGAAAVMIGGHLQYVSGLPEGASVQVVGTSLAGVLVAGTTCLTLWRRVAYGPVAGRGEPSGARAGIWLGAGLATGSLVGDPRLEQVDWLPATPWSLLVLVLLALVVTCWTTQCARLLMASVPARLLPVAAVVGLAGTAGLFAFWLSWWESTRLLFVPDVLAVVREHVRTTYDLADPTSPLVRVVALVAVAILTPGALISWISALLWLVPLAAWTGLPAQRPDGHGWPSLRRVVGAGVTAGVASLALAVVVTLVLVGRGEVRAGPGSLLLLNPVVATLLVGPLGAAALGAALTRGRHGMLVGTVVGGVGLAVCGAGLTVASFGLRCVPGTSCPAEGTLWPVVSPGVLLLVGPAVDVAAVVALVVSGLVAPLRGRRGRSAAAPPSPPGPSAGLVGRRATVAALTALALGVNLVMSIVPSTLTADQGTADARAATVAPAATTPQLRGAQLVAWVRYGGGRLVTRLPDELQQIADGLHELGDGDPAARASIRRGCAGTVGWAADAGTYFTLPEPDLQGVWERAQSLAAGAGTDCLAALDAGDDAAVAAAIGRLDDAAVLANGVVDRITAQVR